MSDSIVKDFFPVTDYCGYTTGDVGMFASQTPPTGFLECDGSLIYYINFKGLYSIIGAKYGTSGSGSTYMFRIPDYRGVFLKGATATQGGIVAQADSLKHHYHQLQRGISPGHTAANGGQAAGFRDRESPISPVTNMNLMPTGGSETRPDNMYILFAIKT